LRVFVSLLKLFLDARFMVWELADIKKASPVFRQAQGERQAHIARMT